MENIKLESFSMLIEFESEHCFIKRNQSIDFERDLIITDKEYNLLKTDKESYEYFINKMLQIYEQYPKLQGYCFNYDHNRNWEEIFNDLEIEWKSQGIRICNCCNKIMREGYCLESWGEYYCSTECLFKNYTEDEYQELYDIDEGTGWTEWDEEGF